MPDFIDPALAIPVALLLWGVYILVRLLQSHEEHRQQMVALAQVQRATATISAIELWGTNPAGWPSEIRELLGVTA